MKVFILSIALTLISVCADAQTQPKPALTLNDVKAMIAFPAESIAARSLSGLVDCWYGLARADNCTEQESVDVAFAKLSDKVLWLADRMSKESEKK